MIFLVFLMNFFFRQNEITLWGKKRIALFQTHIWEQSSFSTRSCVYLPGYTQIRDGGAQYASPGVKLNNDKPERRALAM